MRIAIVTDAWSPQVNGVVTVLVDLRQRLLEIGHDVVLIEPSTHRRLRCPGYPEIELAWRPGEQMTRVLDSAQPDAIHIATEGPLGLAARSHCKRRGLRFTTAFHSRFPEFLTAAFGIPAAWGYAVMRRFHARSAAVMVPSPGTAAILRERGFTNLAQWSHGIDLEMFHPRWRARLDLPRPVFLYVGRISPEKNLEAFLRIDLPGSKLVCGGGPLLDDYKRRYPEVQWRGSVPRHALAAIYGAADVFVYPSRTDTFGLVMLEALACATPVAAYPVAGPLDVVGDSDGGVLDGDLRLAALRALDIPRERARIRALSFDRAEVANTFIDNLVVARGVRDWSGPNIPSMAG